MRGAEPYDSEGKKVRLLRESLLLQARNTMPIEPLILHLPPSCLDQGLDVARLLSHDDRFSWSHGYRLLEQFAMREPEKRFVRVLLRERSNLRLFRTNQRKWCGDFIVVDMSSPEPSKRRIYVLELKAGEQLTEAGETHRQLAGYAQAVAEIARDHGIVAANSTATLLVGSPEDVLGFFGAT